MEKCVEKCKHTRAYLESFRIIKKAMSLIRICGISTAALFKSKPYGTVTWDFHSHLAQIKRTKHTHPVYKARNLMKMPFLHFFYRRTLVRLHSFTHSHTPHTEIKHAAREHNKLTCQWLLRDLLPICCSFLLVNRFLHIFLYLFICALAVPSKHINN